MRGLKGVVQGRATHTVLLGFISLGNPAKTRGRPGRKHRTLPQFQRELRRGEPLGSDRCPPRCWLMSSCASLKMLPLARACPAETRALGSAEASRRQGALPPKVVLALASTEGELEVGCALNPTVTCGLEDP